MSEKAVKIIEKKSGFQLLDLRETLFLWHSLGGDRSTVPAIPLHQHVEVEALGPVHQCPQGSRLLILQGQREPPGPSTAAKFGQYRKAAAT